MVICGLSLPELPCFPDTTLFTRSHSPESFFKKPEKTLIYFDFPRKTGILRKYVTVSCFRNHKPPTDAFIPDTKSSIPEDTDILPAFSRKERPITTIQTDERNRNRPKHVIHTIFGPFMSLSFAEKMASIKINRITGPDTGRYCIQ